MAVGRWNLQCDDGRDLTIRQLALLAGMTEAAVRNFRSAKLVVVGITQKTALQRAILWRPPQVRPSLGRLAVCLAKTA
jgi:hypothetical protein